MCPALQIVPVESQSPAAPLARFGPRVAEYAHACRAEGTYRNYRADWRAFEAWCDVNGVAALPASPETVAAYCTALADRKLAAGTIQHRVSSIATRHAASCLENPAASPLVKFMLAGIRRSLGTAQKGKAPTLTGDIAAMLGRLPENLLGKRNRALLLIGFAGAFRRSELVALNVEDIEFTADGAKILIRRSKTDQEGAGQTIGIAHGGALCPVRALCEWLEAAAITSGPVFRPVRRYMQVQAERLTGHAVAVVVKKYSAEVGLDSRNYSGHSLRAGLVTQAAINGVQELVIMKQTRHRSSDMLRKYIRDASLFRDNASARVGL